MRWLSLFLLLFAPLFSQHGDDDDQLYLSLNIADGQRIQLSNGSTYAIAPADQIYSAYWITPFPIMLSESGDPAYPTKITNMYTGTFVRGKQLVTSEVLEEERQKQLEREKMDKTKPHPPEEKDKAKPETKPEAKPEATPKSQTPAKKPKVKPSTTSALLKQNHINL